MPVSNNSKAGETARPTQRLLELCPQLLTSLFFFHIFAGITEFANMIGTNRTITVVDLSENSIGDTGCIKLARATALNETLERIFVNGNLISDSGCEELSKMLTLNRSLLQLDIERNKILDGGMMSLGTGLGANRTLQVLNVRSNPFTEIGERDLVRALRTNRSLTDLRGIQLNKLNCRRALQLNEKFDCEPNSVILEFLKTQADHPVAKTDTGRKDCVWSLDCVLM
jgi:hypothetical protein